MLNLQYALAGPPPLVDDLATARALFAQVRQALDARGLDLREPPEEPTSCCGRGCNGCVWEGFYAAANYWLDDAWECLRAA
ncbi:oxidoreductase-like domain-containing protein [Ideonella livida]|uniref:Oxidoreductase n=1 Tax=Ideonella livida TaxID=2707176 RepID=A0A7C9TLG0_9BURK|nr:oxidoreductase-like domain-containing protein [Ideonella livida]NDY93158.1 oxidoreductase [Ideonella livida]